MATQNSINKKTQDLTIDPGTSGDSFIQFDINTTGEFRIGVDDDDSDSYKISQGSALGTNDAFIMSSSGRRTLPLQPAFLTVMTSDKVNVTGSGGAAYLVPWDTEIFDIGSNFSSTTFTAPITGRYKLDVNLLLHNVPSSGGTGAGFIQINTSNRNYFQQLKITASSDTNGFALLSCHCVADMDASDVAVIYMNVSCGSTIVDIRGLSSYTWFSGSLIC